MKIFWSLLILFVPFGGNACAVIFLDVDGVLIGSRDIDPLATSIRSKLVELFGEKEERYRGYSELQWRIAASYFLDSAAVERLERLIRLASDQMEVVIVLSSSWRMDGDLSQIQSQMFAGREFAKWIVDKTPDEDWWRRRRGEEALSPVCLAKYGFPLGTRGAEIDFWLRENREKWDIEGFVILDDWDSGISKRFSDRFVKVESVLTEEDVEKAYRILRDCL